MQRAQEIAFFFSETMEFDFAGLAAKLFEFMQTLFIHGRLTLYFGRSRVQQGRCWLRPQGLKPTLLRRADAALHPKAKRGTCSASVLSLRMIEAEEMAG